MATITAISRRTTMYRRDPDCGKCDACCKPYGELFESGKSLGFGMDDPRALELTKGDPGEHKDGSPYATYLSGRYELRGYGRCMNSKEVERLVVDFVLDDSRTGSVILDAGADNAMVLESIAAWAKADDAAADELRGATV